MKKPYFLLTVLFLLLISAYAVWVSYDTSEYIPKVRSVFVGDGLYPVPNRDDPVLWASAILKIKVVGVNEKEKPRWGNISYKVKIIEDLKSSYSGVIDLYAPREQLKKGGTYLVFMNKIDTTFYDKVYYCLLNEYQWDIKWGRLNNVPAVFMEFKKYSEVKKWIQSSANIKKYDEDQTPPVEKYRDIDEKIKASARIIEVTVKSVQDNGYVLVTGIGPSMKYYKGNEGDITAISALFLFNRKYKIEKGDTLLLFFDKNNRLAAREGCLINKKDTEEWQKNREKLR